MAEPPAAPAPAPPAVRERPPDTEYERIARRGVWLAAVEGAAPSDHRAGAAAAYRVWIADALDLGPAAAGDLFVIDSKVTISSQLLRALAEREGYRVERLTESDDAEKQTARLSFNGTTLATVTYTIEQARKAGLADKKNWRTYPDRMLWARASTYAIRDGAPGIAVGMRTTEEMGGDEVVDAPEPASAPEPEPVEDAEWEALSPEERAVYANQTPDPPTEDDDRGEAA